MLEAQDSKALSAEVTFCRSSRDSMAEILPGRYFDFPLSEMPHWAIRLYAQKWVKRDDLVYADAWDREGTLLGFVFGHSLGGQPWRILLAEPKWMLPFALLLFVRRKIGALRNSGGTRMAVSRTSAGSEPVCPDRPYVMLEMIYVEARARGRGVATQLMKAFEAQARSQGPEEFRANIAAKNHASQALFKRMGWNIAPVSATMLRAWKAPIQEQSI